MANKKNVEANKKNSETKNEKSNELEQQKPTKKKKLRLHSHLKVNIPLFQSLMMILPSLAKHGAAEGIDNSSGAVDQVTANSVTEKYVTDDHTQADSSAVTHQEAQTSDSDVNSTLNASHAPHGSSSHLVPSHHLSTLSHPQIHYIPSVSMPTISSGNNGQPTHSNAPTTPALPVTFMPEVIKGTYGELHVDANGQYTFVLNPNSPQYILLNQHQPGTDHFALHLSNGSSIIVQIPVTGKQDTPNISGDLTGVVTEDHNIDSQGLLHANGKIDVIDPDQSESSVTPEVISGKYGSLTIDADGHWQYQVDNSLSNVQALTAATSLHESFTIHTKDGTPQTIDMTIGGNDDNAVITGVDAGAVTEDLTTQVQGQLSVTDSDLGEDHFQASQVTSNFGTLSITKDGAWTYNLDNNNPVVQGLGQGSTATDIVTVHSADGTAHQVMVTINGTNDKATVSSATVAIDETDKVVTTSGTLTSTDIDNPDNIFTPDSISGTNGDLTIDANGHWTFTANSAFNQLNVGDKVEETFTVSSIDGTPSTIKVTINGTNDAAVISGTDTGDVHEGHTYTEPDGHMTGGSVDDRSPDHMHGNIGKLSNDLIHTEGQLIITDADKGESHVATGTYQGHYGHIIMLPSGEWNYYASIGQNSTGRKIDRLGQGETLTDTVTIKSADGTRHDINITIHGDNDSPYTSSEVVLVNGDEDKAIILTAAQLLQNTVDVDANDRGQLSIENLQANHGAITVNPNGTFTFTPSKDYNGQVHFSYDVKDAHGGVTHTGATTTLVAVNDNPDVQPITDSVTEDTDSHHTVDLLGSAKDVDGDPLSVNHIQVTFEGHTGPLPVGVSIAPDGHTLIIDSHSSAFQHLSAGEKSDITIQYTVADNHGGQTPATATITMIGADDKAQLQSSTIDITEGQALHTFNSLSFINGQIGLVDPDTHDKTAFVHSTSAGNQGYGRLSMWPDGHYTFSLDWARNHYADDKIAALKQNETLTDQYQIQTSDGQTKLITITIHGEDSGARIDVLMPHSLPASQHIYEEHFVPASQTHLYAGGRLKVIDPDHDDAYLQPETIQTAHHGEFRINANGGWNYKIDNSIDEVQHLGAGESFTETHTVHSKDGTASQLLTVTVHGTNDIPTVSAEVKLAPGVEDTDIQLTTSELLSHATDIDHNDIGQLSVANLVADHGSIVDNKDGTFTFHPTKNYNGDVHFSYDVKDPHGGITHTGASTSLAAVDDKAIISGLDTGDINESSRPDRSPDHAHSGMGEITNDLLYVDGKLNIIDGDSGENTFDSKGLGYAYHGQYGNLMLLKDGTWHYNIEVGQQASGVGRAIDKLGEGESLTDTITVYSKDGTAHDIVITIHGDNDKPYCSSEVHLNSGKEDTVQVLTLAQLLQNTVDVDANDLGKLTIENLHTDHGSIASNPDGSFAFTPEKNYNGDVHFSYDVKDAHGGITHTGASTTLSAVNDAGVITGDKSGTVSEDRHVQGDAQHTIYTVGVLDVTDPDAGENHFHENHNVHALHDPFGGSFTIGKAGDWSYSVPNSNVQHLAKDQVETVQYEVLTQGGDKHIVTVSIHGTNDAPTLSVTQTTPTTGTLTETDVDVKDTHSFSVVNSSGQFGDLTVDPNSGAYVYTPNSTVAGMSFDKATHTYHGTDVFEVKVADNHGGESSRFLTFDINGQVNLITGQQPTITTTVPQNPVVTTAQPSLPTSSNTPPSNAVTVDLATSSDSGNSDTDNLTNDTTPTITGHTDIPFSKVTIYDDSTPVGHSVSDASGQYSVAVSSLSEGDHNLSAKALAPSSVLPATSSLLSVHIDTQVHVGIQTDPITADNVINAQESNSSIDITGSVSGDFNTGDVVTLNVNGIKHTGAVDSHGHYSIAVPGSELIADADQKIEASIAVTDSAGNSAHATTDVVYQVDTQVSLPTITFESAGADNLYSKAEIARGDANTITATITPPGDAKIGEHLVVNGQDHVLDAHSLQNGLQIEVAPGSHVQVTMTDEHGNTAGSQGFAASAIPDPIIVKAPPGSHQVSGSLGTPPLLPSLTPVPTAQHGWRIHLPDGSYVTSHHGQYGTLTIDPQTGDLHYQEQANVHTGPHGSASGIGQHEDKFEVALQGTNQDEVVAHVNVQILSHGPGNSGKLNIGTEVVDMTITPITHTSHPAPPPPPPVLHDEPDMSSQADFTVTQSDDSYLDLTQHAHQVPDQKTSHHGAAAYLDALGIKPDATSTTVDDQPADMDIVLAQVDQPDAATHDQAHLDMSDALEHHDANINHNQDDEHHHHNDVDGLPDIDPNP
ncbi:VCBS domain-containing protein [Vibrio sp. 10N.261.46.E11]|uniref:VCBS domain-containing protein n=1 Tax=Vibrio sp. 10N.261.46.E11 TaxID=3229662 RepID=UPI00354B7ACB